MNPKLVADRVALRPVLARHGLVDHRELRAAARFGAHPKDALAISGIRSTGK